MSVSSSSNREGNGKLADSLVKRSRVEFRSISPSTALKINESRITNPVPSPRSRAESRRVEEPTSLVRMGIVSSSSSSTSTAAPPPGEGGDSRGPRPTSELADLPVAQLREMAAALGVDLRGVLEKSELVRLIEERRRQREAVMEPSVSSSSLSSASVPTASPAQMSKWKMITTAYEEIVKAIIRPPRSVYVLDELGKRDFRLNGLPYRRKDFKLTNPRGMMLECSWWCPLGEDPVTQPTLNSKRHPVVIYLHGNSSCRVEALEVLPYILKAGFTLFAFDFAGSGLSQGEYVSLGYYEREDLTSVVSFLRETNRVSTLSLWGRSMGSATALLFADRDPSIACMILDSPFSSLKTLAKELVEHAEINVPGFALGIAMRMVRSSVRSRAGFDINALDTLSNASKCFVPALFAAAKGDDFIRCSHAKTIHDAYAGDKNLVLFEGDHNSRRPRFFFDSAVIFLLNCAAGGALASSPGSGSGTGASGRGEGLEEFTLGGNFAMPAPMSNRGAGLGINVGTQAAVAAAARRAKESVSSSKKANGLSHGENSARDESRLPHAQQQQQQQQNPSAPSRAPHPPDYDDEEYVDEDVARGLGLDVRETMAIGEGAVDDALDEEETFQRVLRLSLVER